MPYPISILSSLDMHVIQTLHVKLDGLSTVPHDMLNTILLRHASFLISYLATGLMQNYLTV